MNDTQAFNPKELSSLYKPLFNSSKGDNGQITIIGGSSLFHGAPLLALTAASRVVDMVFFASPEKSVTEVANTIKSRLFSFIWVPWKDTAEYIEKSDAVLIGPGLMRTPKTRSVTKYFLTKFADKKWVIDAGSLQMLNTSWIPKGAILTPNEREYKMLFGDLDIDKAAKKFNCMIVLKKPVTIVCSSQKCVEIGGGNPGLTKGGTGDAQAGLTTALLAKNNPFLAACAASYAVKKAGDELYQKVGEFYNADDLVDKLPEVLASL
jgi:NAD(P)H-hydrate epimerase